MRSGGVVNVLRDCGRAVCSCGALYALRPLRSCCACGSRCPCIALVALQLDILILRLALYPNAELRAVPVELEPCAPLRSTY